jgi:leucine-rich repeat protein SHOC2
MQKTFLLLCLVLLITGHSFAQETQSPYEIALERIEAAEQDGASTLELNYLGLTEVPPEIGRLSNLQKLYLYGNKLSSLPPEIGNLSSLQELYLYDNKLSSLPPEIGNLSNLQELYLYNNQLSSLPPEIGNLDKLELLFLNSNQLSNLPPTFGDFANLQALWLNNNHLSSLPTEFGNLTNLCFLDLRNNSFQDIPPAIAPLKNLAADSCGDYHSILFLDDTLLDTLPHDVATGGTSAILAYLDNVAAWHLQKLILGGVSALGLVTLSVLGFRWKNRRGKAKRKNEELK